MILELTWDDFFKHKKFNSRMNNFNISLTNNLINSVKIVCDKNWNTQTQSVTVE